MRFYDRRCESCGATKIDSYEPTDPPVITCTCGQPMVRAWLTKTPAVHGDEIDIWVRHGICNDDATPRHYRSKAEMRRVTKEKGLVNRFEHCPLPGTDKSKFSRRWI